MPCRVRLLSSGGPTSGEDGIVDENPLISAGSARFHETRFPHRFRRIAHGEEDDNTDAGDSAGEPGQEP